MNDRKRLIALSVAVFAVVGLLVFGLTRGSGQLSVHEPTDAVVTNTSSPVGTPEWRVAATTVEQGLNDLFMNPDPDRVSEFVDPDCECFAEIRKLLADLERNGQRYDGNTVEIVNARLLDQSGTDEYTVRLTIKEPAVNLVGRSGEVLEEHKEILGGRTDYVLRRGPESRWKLLDRSAPS